MPCCDGQVDKREAESKQKASEQIAIEIKHQEEEIAKTQAVVKQDLDKALPALIEAQNSVNSIKKADLAMVAGFPSPPQAVRLALEPVILMLGEPSCLRHFLT